MWRDYRSKEKHIQQNQHHLLHRNHPFHYAWVVCFTGLLLIFVSMGLGSNGFSLFLPFIMEGLGYTATQTSTLITIRCFVSFFAMLLIGFYYRFFSIRVGATIAGACSAIAYLMFAFAKSYAIFCFGSVLMGFSYGLGSMIPVSILMGRWFHQKRSTAIGICAVGSTLSTMIMPFVTTALVEHLSLGKAFLIEGILIAIMVVLIFIFMRSDPREMGLKAYGDKRTKKKANAVSAAEDTVKESASAGEERESADSISVAEAEDRSTTAAAKDSASTDSASAADAAKDSASDAATRDSAPAAAVKDKDKIASNPQKQARPAGKGKHLFTKGEWILVGGVSFTMGAIANPGFSHLPVLFSYEGFSPVAVASFISLLGITICISKIACGSVADKFGGKRATLLFSISLLIGHLMCGLSFMQNIPISTATVIFLGIGYPIATIGPSIWAGDLTTPMAYETTVRRLQVAYAAGALLLSNMAGIIKDLCGSYIPAFLALAGLLMISLFLIMKAYDSILKR